MTGIVLLILENPGEPRLAPTILGLILADVALARAVAEAEAERAMADLQTRCASVDARLASWRAANPVPSPRV